MNSEAILQSDLLDIIFEKRNKEYGAYDLRKHYEEQMRFSLLIMCGLVLLFFLFRLLFGGAHVAVQKNSAVIQIHENKVSDFKRISMPVGKKAIVHSKSKSRIETTPGIVDEKLINKTVASVNEPVPSNNIKVEGNENLVDGNRMGMNFESTENKIVIAEKKKVVEKEVLPVAEIMPQYPGGLKTLLAYLKKKYSCPAG